MYEDVLKTGQDWIEHHGIAGQKWGQQNGPPYPLGDSDHSAAEKSGKYQSEKAGYKPKPGFKDWIKKKKVEHDKKVRVKKMQKGRQKAAEEKKKAEEEKNKFEAEKKTALEKGNTDWAKANASKLSNQELNDIMNRQQTIKRLNDIPSEAAQKGEDTINKIMKVAKITSDALITANTLYDAKENYLDKWGGRKAKEEKERKEKEEAAKKGYKLQSIDTTKNANGSTKTVTTYTLDGVKHKDEINVAAPKEDKDKKK